MKVKVHYPQSIALKAGVARWGDIEVALQPILDLLEEDERGELSVDTGGRLRVKGVTTCDEQLAVEGLGTEDVVSAIRGVLGKNEMQRQAKIAELDEILQEPSKYVDPDGRRKMFFTSDDITRKCVEARIDPAPYENVLELESQRQHGVWAQQWRRFFDDWTPGIRDNKEYPYHRWYNPGSSGVLPLDHARKLATGFGFDDVVGRIDVYERAEEQRKAEAREKIAQAQAESRQAWQAWAVEHGPEDLKLAIAEEYPVGMAIERACEAAFYPAPGSADIKTYDTMSDAEDRRVPNQGARCLQAYLKDKVATVKGQLPAHTSMEVGRIKAVELWIECDCDPEYPCGECDRDHEIKIKRTAVPVYLRAPHYDSERWYVIE